MYRIDMLKQDFRNMDNADKIALFSAGCGIGLLLLMVIGYVLLFI